VVADLTGMAPSLSRTLAAAVSREKGAPGAGAV